MPVFTYSAALLGTISPWAFRALSPLRVTDTPRASGAVPTVQPSLADRVILSLCQVINSAPVMAKMSSWEIPSGRTAF